MPMQVTKIGTAIDARTGLACAALEVRLGGLVAELPALSATYSDYDHASRAGERLDARTFNYYHRVSPACPLGHRSTLDNIAARVRAVQGKHRPPLTVISVEQPGGGLGDGDLAAFHELQRRLGLPIITTIEKDPDQGVEGLRKELDEFEKFDASQNKFPTISVKTYITDFEAKLRHVTKNYPGFNLQWGGYKRYFSRWSLLSKVLRDRDVWCNVVGITPKYRTVTSLAGQKIRPTNIGNALLFGGHSYCFAWPRRQPAVPGPKRSQGQGGQEVKRPAPGRPMLFNPVAWCYDPCELAAPAARTRSFNAMQAALARVRRSIRDGTLYGRHCGEALGLREAMARIPRSS